MTITAKFASKCPVCRKGIDAGSRVEWNRGEKARHLGCEQTAPATSAPAIFHYSSAGKPACGGQGRSIRSTASVDCPSCQRMLAEPTIGQQINGRD